jgi:hypothetical protein
MVVFFFKKCLAANYTCKKLWELVIMVCSLSLTVRGLP